MTNKQRVSIRNYIAFLASHLGLNDWSIRLMPQVCENPNHAATVVCTPGRKIAQVTLAEDWLEQTPEEQRHVLIHELIHVHADHEFQYIEDTLPTLIGSVAYLPFEKAYRDLHEHAVDALASAMEDHFPVPVV